MKTTEEETRQKMYMQHNKSGMFASLFPPDFQFVDELQLLIFFHNWHKTGRVDEQGRTSEQFSS
jgi:hypothetical protein